MIDESIMGKCGFYCGACPTFIKENCKGCSREHKHGDCYTNDCVTSKKISFCGECDDFPCETILTKEHCTVLDKDWLYWKKKSKTNT